MSLSPPPSDRLGSLFAAVQEARLFPDSKTFADATPRRPEADILAEWERDRPAGEALRAFVGAGFDLPAAVAMPAPDRLPLADHIRALWPVLTRRSGDGGPSSELPLPHPYVVPGGRFRELYYWDSWFTMLGLVRSGEQGMVEAMIANFGSLLERVGHIPNGTRSYYLSRSHPPFFYLMARLSTDDSTEGRRRRLGWMRTEHAYWMEGADALPPGGEHRRVVRLADGAILNRYWDDRAAPRDESWAEDVELADGAGDRQADRERLWRDIRAAAESGWDFSSRWLGDGRTLATIRTTRMLPIDLNCLLFGLEQEIAVQARALGEDAAASRFADLAERRRDAVGRHLWHEAAGHFADHDLDRGEISARLTGAAAFPLFTGLADDARARRSAEAIGSLLRPGGLLATLAHTGQQWDAPNGWAPLQWVAISGLRRYGENALAGEIARRWLAMVEAQYRETGQLFEKYDVEAGTAGSGGEYAGETGFGWTNGVTLELLHGGDEA